MATTWWPGRSHLGRASRGVLLTAAGPGMREVMHELAVPTFRSYAQAWGYEVHAVDLASDGVGADPDAQRVKWAKLSLVREALRDHALVVWLDADVLLMRHDEDVSALLHPRAFQGLVLEHVPAEDRVNPNTGVWVLRSCPTSLAFLQTVQAAGQQPGPWADQGAVLTALGWRRGDSSYRGARPGMPTAFSRRTTWLPARWNSPFLGPRQPEDCFSSTPESYVGRSHDPDPCALHFMGLTPAGRLRAMSTHAPRTAPLPV